jgi:hypothetical protein
MPDRPADRHREAPFPLRGLGPFRSRIDDYVKRAGGTVTSFLLRAAEEKLDREEAER